MLLSQRRRWDWLGVGNDRERFGGRRGALLWRRRGTRAGRAPLPRPGRPSSLRCRNGDQTVAKALQRRPGGLLLSLLLGRPMPGAERFRSREDDGCVLALVAYAGALAVIERGR